MATSGASAVVEHKEISVTIHEETTEIVTVERKETAQTRHVAFSSESSESLQNRLIQPSSSSDDVKTPAMKTTESSDASASSTLPAWDDKHTGSDRLFLIACILVIAYSAMAVANIVDSASWVSIGLLFGAAALHAVIALGARNCQLPLPRLRLVAHCSCLAQLCVLVASSLLNQGANSVALWYLIYAPVYVAFLLHMHGVRDCLAWGAVSLLCVLGVHVGDGRQWLIMAAQLVMGLVNIAFACAMSKSIEQTVTQLRAREELAREQGQALAVVRDQALEATKIKAQFVANISHELRTPLNGVIGLATMLLETELSPDQQDLTTTIIKCGKTLLMIVSDMLDFSKIESGKLFLDNRQFSCLTCVEDVLEMFAPTARKKELELCVVCDNVAPPMVNGDMMRVRQVLTNLVGNALKFTQQGEVVVTIHPVQLVSNPDGTEDAVVHFSVRDSGVGIEPQVLTRLFSAFTQADESSTRKHGGTGLGLALCKRLVHMWQGELWAESKVGVGSTFHFTVRSNRRVPHHTASTPRELAAGPASADSPSGSSARSLSLKADASPPPPQQSPPPAVDSKHHNFSVSLSTRSLAPQSQTVNELSLDVAAGDSPAKSFSDSPVNMRASSDDGPPGAPSELGSPLRLFGAKCLILDSAANSRAISALVMSWGMQPRTVSSEEELNELAAKNEQFDIVLALDTMLSNPEPFGLFALNNRFNALRDSPLAERAGLALSQAFGVDLAKANRARARRCSESSLPPLSPEKQRVVLSERKHRSQQQQQQQQSRGRLPSPPQPNFRSRSVDAGKRSIRQQKQQLRFAQQENAAASVASSGSFSFSTMMPSRMSLSARRDSSDSRSSSSSRQLTPTHAIDSGDEAEPEPESETRRRRINEIKKQLRNFDDQPHYFISQNIDKGERDGQTSNPQSVKHTPRRLGASPAGGRKGAQTDALSLRRLAASAADRKESAQALLAPRCKWILLTVSGHKHYRAQMLRRGFTGVLRKPVRSTLLKRAVLEALDAIAAEMEQYRKAQQDAMLEAQDSPRGRPLTAADRLRGRSSPAASPPGSPASKKARRGLQQNSPSVSPRRLGGGGGGGGGASGAPLPAVELGRAKGLTNSRTSSPRLPSPRSLNKPPSSSLSSSTASAVPSVSPLAMGVLDQLASLTMADQAASSSNAAPSPSSLMRKPKPGLSARARIGLASSHLLAAAVGSGPSAAASTDSSEEQPASGGSETAAASSAGSKLRRLQELDAVSDNSTDTKAPTAADDTALPSLTAAARGARALRGRRGGAKAGKGSPLLGQKHPLSLLVVDDNAVNRKVACRMLSHLGYNPEIAMDGVEALELIGKKAQSNSYFDVIFMDLSMPRIDGLAATELIRRGHWGNADEKAGPVVVAGSLPREHQPYIVALTANVTDQHRAACFDKGMGDFVGKPVEVKRLSQALRTFVRQRQQQASAASATSTSSSAASSAKNSPSAPDEPHDADAHPVFHLNESPPQQHRALAPAVAGLSINGSLASTNPHQLTTPGPPLSTPGVGAHLHMRFSPHS